MLPEIPADQARFLNGLLLYLPAHIDAAMRHQHHERKLTHKLRAVRHCEIRPNYPNRLKYIILDVDRAGARDAWRGLPPPNIVTEFVATGHAHLVWVLDVAIDTTNPDRTARNLFDDVRRDMNELIGGDPGYNGLDMTHSWWSPTYRTVVLSEHRYGLRELRVAVPRRKSKTKLYLVADLHDRENRGRNCRCYYRTRRYAVKLLARPNARDDAAFEADVRAFMQAEADRARIDMPNVEPYTDSEMAYSLKSALKYARRHAPALRARTLAHDLARKRTKRQSVPRDVYTATADERRIKIAAMLAEAVPITVIADTLGCSRQEVYRLRKCNGLSSQQEYSPVAPVNSSLVFEKEATKVSEPLSSEKTSATACLSVFETEASAEPEKIIENSVGARLLARRSYERPAGSILLRSDPLPPAVSDDVVDLAARSIGSARAREAFLAAQRAWRGSG